jgi:hypothetical protein
VRTFAILVLAFLAGFLCAIFSNGYLWTEAARQACADLILH